MPLVRPLTAALLMAAAALAAPAGASGAPSLSGTTVVTSTLSGYVDVVLTKQARLSPRSTGNPDVAITGTGRLLGAWLKPLDAATDDSLEVMRLPAFLGGTTRTRGSTEPKPVCTDGITGSTCSAPTPTAVVLHPGRYRLVLLTDNRPVQVVLRLHGLPGRVLLRPSHELASAQMPLPQLETVGTSVVTYGGTGPFGGRLDTWVAATAKAPGTELDGASVCERQDAGDAPPFAYSSTCPGGTSGGYEYTVHGRTYGVYGAFATSGLLSAEAVGLGGSFTNDKGVVLGQTLGVWLRQP